MISVDISEKGMKFCGQSAGRLYGDTHRGKSGILEIFPEYQRRGQAKKLRILGVTLPKADKILTVRFDEPRKWLPRKIREKRFEPA